MDGFYYLQRESIICKVNYELIHKDLNEFETNTKYDVIISNPPYFVSSEDLKNKNERKKKKNTKPDFAG